MIILLFKFNAIRSFDYLLKKYVLKVILTRTQNVSVHQKLVSAFVNAFPRRHAESSVYVHKSTTTVTIFFPKKKKKISLKKKKIRSYFPK